MLNYELRAKLNNLTLAGQNEDGELEWIGTNEQWSTVESYLRERDSVVEDIERGKNPDTTLDEAE